MKYKPLVIFLIIVAILSAGFITAMGALGQQGFFLAQFYMLVPAISAIITRLFFYEKRFRDANLRIGRPGHYLKFWAAAIGITLLSYAIFTLLGSITWDFTGQSFLDNLSEQFALAGLSMNETLPPGFTPEMMLLLFFIGGLTVFNILPGIITGFGEEFGWRGFMFPQLYRIRPWVAFIIGGLIWFAWHILLVFVYPQAYSLTPLETALNVIVLAIGSVFTFAFLAYVYVKTENILVASVTHITLNNSAMSFGYFAVIQNQLLANFGLTVTMLIVIIILFYSGQLKVFEEYFKRA